MIEQPARVRIRRQLHGRVGEIASAGRIQRHAALGEVADTLNRQLRAGIDDPQLAELVIALYEEGRLCLVSEDERTREPQIICSMGLAAEEEA